MLCYDAPAPVDMSPSTVGFSSTRRLPQRVVALVASILFTACVQGSTQSVLPGHSGSAGPAQLRDDLEALLHLRQSLDYFDRVSPVASWVEDQLAPPTQVCSWRGVTCSERRDRVQVLNITGSKDTFALGMMPAALSALDGLRELHAGGNWFRGNLPPEWSALSQLTIMNVSGNRISGQWA